MWLYSILALKSTHKKRRKNMRHFHWFSNTVRYAFSSMQKAKLFILKSWKIDALKKLSTYCLLEGFWDSDKTGKIGFYRFDKIRGASRPRNHLYFLTSFLGLFMRKRSVSPAAKLVVFWAWEQRKWAFIFRKIVDNYHDVAVLVVPYTSCRSSSSSSESPEAEERKPKCSGRCHFFKRQLAKRRWVTESNRKMKAISMEKSSSGK